MSLHHVRVRHPVWMAWKRVETWSLAHFLQLNCPTARGGRFVIGGKGLNDPGKRGEEKMFTELTHNPRAMKAIRLGLMVTSWTFVVLGFVLTHNA